MSKSRRRSKGGCQSFCKASSGTQIGSCWGMLKQGAGSIKLRVGSESQQSSTAHQGPSGNVSQRLTKRAVSLCLPTVCNNPGPPNTIVTPETRTQAAIIVLVSCWYHALLSEAHTSRRCRNRTGLTETPVLLQSAQVGICRLRPAVGYA